MDRGRLWARAPRWAAAKSTRARLRALLGLITALVVMGAVSAPAGAYSAAPGYAAQDYATGFVHSDTAVGDVGPIGIAFDKSDNLYVSDPVDQDLYRFQPGGGVASAATRINSAPLAGRVFGLIFTRSGDLYAARYQAGDVVQLNPDTGQVLRTVASVPCATGLAVDPVSGDLFVSSGSCEATISRISNFAGGPGTVTAYTSAADVDGLTFDQSGTLYAQSDSLVLKIQGVSSSQPGAVSAIASVPNGDGLVFGAHTSGEPPFLAANRRDGIVTRVEFNGGQVTESNIFTGGSRGDFAAVDSHGCLYVTQSDRVVRMSNPGEQCAFEPTTPVLPGPAGHPKPGIRVTISRCTAVRLHGKPRGSNRRCCAPVKSLRLRVVQQGGVQLKQLTIYAGRKRLATVRGAAVTGPITLRKLPKKSFTLKVVAVTTKGLTLTSQRVMGKCAPPKPACLRGTRLRLKVLGPKGSRVVRVYVDLNGRRVGVFRGHALTSVLLRNVPQRRLSIKLTAVSSRGAVTVTRYTYRVC